MTRTITHIESRRQAAIECKVRIQKLLRWSDETYCWYKYNTGLRYISIYQRDDVEGQIMSESNRVFWNWWKNQWCLREEVFLQDYNKLIKLRPETIIRSYKALHNAQSLAMEIHPHAKALGDSYAVMMQELIDNEHAKTQTV